MNWIYNMKTEHQDQLIGTDQRAPRFSWNINYSKSGVKQASYYIKVYRNECSGEKTLVWDSGEVYSEQTNGITYAGEPLKSRNEYCWSVRVRLNTGEISDWSQEACWEMGLLEEADWTASWIEPEQKEVVEEPEFSLMDMFIHQKKPDQAPIEERLHPPQFIRKAFNLENKEIVRARLYSTALGVYHVTLNGKNVADTVFAPDFTSYNNYLQYQTYDVTSLLSEENVLGFVLADGWYAGRISIPGGSAQFGNHLALLAQLEILFSDGTAQRIETDDTFTSSTGHIVYSDIFIGEKQNRSLKKEGWNQADFQENSNDWKPVKMASGPFSQLKAQYGPGVKAMDELEPVDTWKEGNSYIFDFGQVIAGRIKAVFECKQGEEITFEHSEVLNEAGQFFNNIVGRNKEQTDIYIASGKGEETFEPVFTFHGFRYVKISGYSGVLLKKNLKALVLYSDMKVTGTFKTSHPELNQLWSNIQWSQKGNMLSIPTDCPQRERAGWTGDIQAFAPTAAFNMDVQAFLTRWLWNLQTEQTEEGEIFNYSPAPKDILKDKSFTGSISSAGWGDAIIIVPWVLYERYGDMRILEECFPHMQEWLGFAEKSASENKKDDWTKYLWDTKFHYGDWMIPSFMMGDDAKGPLATSAVTKDCVATAFFAYSAKLLSKIAQILQKPDEAAYYEGLHKKIKNAFQKAYVTNEGLLLNDYQGVYVLALAFKLLNEEQVKSSVKRLVELIEQNGNRLDTGFLSVPYIMDVLCRYGYEDTAFALLFQTQCPSWLYEVNNGATTIWESWDSIKPDGKVGSFSFNHYAFGCVGDWLARYIGGISPIEPGYRTFRVSPHFPDQLDFVQTTFKSISGHIHVEWKVNADEEVLLSVTVPPNTEAKVELNDVNRASAQMLVHSLIERGYADAIYNESAGRVTFTALAGQMKVQWPIIKEINNIKQI